MGKEEKMLEELLTKVSLLEDKIQNMEFLLVQGMGAGTMDPSKLSSITGSPVSAPVEVDLAPLEGRISQIEILVNQIVTKVDKLSELTAQLSSGKAQKADELIGQATSLLEKGLQLTELETTLLEFKDRVEEVIIQLEVSNIGASEAEDSV
ncbi:MAG: hypothetical protein ACFFE8_09770 [Candidatus Heimdallarchaeota archaeon]